MKYGTKLCLIQSFFLNRSYSCIKNRYYSFIKPKLEFFESSNNQPKKETIFEIQFDKVFKKFENQINNLNHIETHPENSIFV